MTERLLLSASEHLDVVSSDASAFVVHAVHGPGGKPPPAHLHPAHAEHFEVLSDGLRARVDGWDRLLGEGDRLDVPPGTVHQMWNPSGEEAVVRWEMRPAGRTEEWFRALDALFRGSPTGRPDPLALAVVLEEFRDVLRLAAAPDPVLRVVVRALAGVGRRRGRRLPSPA